MSQQYQNPPIREAVCEFRYQEGTHWDWAAPGQIYAALASEFPRRLPIEQGNGSPNVQLSQVSPPVLQQLVLRLGFQGEARFWRESDESGHIAVSPYRLGVHHRKPYPSWKGFSEIIGKCAKAYQEVLKPTKVQRIGLRYINDINLGRGTVELEDFFDFYPFVGHTISQNLSRFQCMIQINFEDARDSLTLQIMRTRQPEGGNAQVTLDLDYFLVQPDSIELSETTEWLETAHSNLESVFEGCLKDSARELFR